MKQILIISVLLGFYASGCNKCRCDTNGTLKNLTGLDGCGWVIQRSDKNETLEPVNLKDFNVTLQDGKKIKFSYQETEGFSVCMVGKTVKITRICEKCN
jgi:hypothetical protein